MCSQHDLVNDSGVVVWLDGAQVALFYLPGMAGKNLYAIDNHDPQSGANVIGRGLVGSIKGDLVLRHLSTSSTFVWRHGSCLEYPQLALPPGKQQSPGMPCEQAECASAHCP